MDTASPFAQMPPTPDPIVARVRVELERLAAGLPTPPNADPARLADETVRRLWDSRVRVFVPVLALREARERLLAGSEVAESTGKFGDQSVPSDGVGDEVRPHRSVGPWAGAMSVAALGWPAGEVLAGRPWLGAGLAGWIGLLTAMWTTERSHR